jgi:uncharacterized cupredoxin-like copper-binding protein
MKKILFIILLLAASLVACNSNRPVSKLDVELSDFAINPDHFIVKAGTEITIKVTNSGSVDHDLTIMKFGIDVGDTFDIEDKQNSLLEIKVSSGASETVTFQVPDQVGIYQVVCGLPGHLQAGMRATLEIVE